MHLFIYQHIFSLIHPSFVLYGHVQDFQEMVLFPESYKIFNADQENSILSYWILFTVGFFFVLFYVLRFDNSSLWTVHIGLTEQLIHEALSLNVKSIIYHAQYRPKGLDHDIALMKLEKALVFNGMDFIFFLSETISQSLLFALLLNLQRRNYLSFYCFSFMVERSAVINNSHSFLTSLKGSQTNLQLIYILNSMSR